MKKICPKKAVPTHRAIVVVVGGRKHTAQHRARNQTVRCGAVVRTSVCYGVALTAIR